MSAGSWVVARMVTVAVVESLQERRHGARPGPVERGGRLVEDEQLGTRRPSPGRARRAAARRPTARRAPVRRGRPARTARGRPAPARGRPVRPGRGWPARARRSRGRTGTARGRGPGRPGRRAPPGTGPARRGRGSTGPCPSVTTRPSVGRSRPVIEPQQRRLARPGRPGHDVEAAAPERGGRRRQPERPARALAVLTGRALEDDGRRRRRTARRAAAQRRRPARAAPAPASRASSMTAAGTVPGGPSRSATARPSATWMTRSAMRSTSSSWVTIRQVVPSARTTSRRTARISSAVAPSSSPVGSSARRSAGRAARATAKAMRCCSPPDSWWR